MRLLSSRGRRRLSKKDEPGEGDGDGKDEVIAMM